MSRPPKRSRSRNRNIGYRAAAAATRQRRRDAIWLGLPGRTGLFAGTLRGLGIGAPPGLLFMTPLAIPSIVAAVALFQVFAMIGPIFAFLSSFEDRYTRDLIAAILGSAGGPGRAAS